MLRHRRFAFYKLAKLPRSMHVYRDHQELALSAFSEKMVSNQYSRTRLSLPLFFIATSIAMGMVPDVAMAVTAGERLQRLGNNVPVPKLRSRLPASGNEADTAAPSPGEAGAGDEIAIPEQPPVVSPTILPPAIEPPQAAETDALPLKADDEVQGQKISHPTCTETLRKMAIFEVSDQPVDGDDECRIDNPVILKSTSGRDPVAFSDGLLLSCQFATRLTSFVSDTVQPLAQYHVGARLTEIRSGQGYVCRRRNNAPDGKLSEHAFGEAIDMVSFGFDGQDSLPVGAAEKMVQSRADFFNAVRRAACGTFTTILGPGSNAAHATHLHLDTGRMEDNENPYRICQ